MLKTIAVIVLCAINFLAMWLVFQNRASEKLVTALLSGTFALITAIALALFVFVPEPDQPDDFPVSFMISNEHKDQALLGFPPFGTRFSSAPMGALEKLKQLDSLFLLDANDEYGQNLYHHLLQRLIVEWLTQHYQFTWMINRKQYDVPGPSPLMTGPAVQPLPAGTTLRRADLTKLLNGNRFADVPIFELEGIALVLPPNTTLVVEPPKLPNKALETSEITIHNRFCKITIRISWSGGSSGLDLFGKLLNRSDKEQFFYTTANYTVTTQAVFTPWLAGHPDMPSHRLWAQQMVRLLREDFDEQRAWKKGVAELEQLKARLPEQAYRKIVEGFPLGGVLPPDAKHP